MTDPGDDKVGARYRALAREEPGADLDAAILAASRRALGRPSFTRRWGAPLSIAAVLVLAVGVSLRMQVESPGVEYAEPMKQAAPPAAQTAPAPGAAVREPTAPATLAPAAPEHSRAEAPAKPQRKRTEAFGPQALQRSAPAEAPALAKEAAPPDARNERALADRTAPQPFPSTTTATASAPPPAAPAPAAPPAVAQEDARAAVARKDAAPAPQIGALRAPAAAAPRARDALEARPVLRAEAARDDPVEELERIARLRAEGRHADADKALDEFRRRHAGYRIPDPTWERVKPPTR